MQLMLMMGYVLLFPLDIRFDDSAFAINHWIIVLSYWVSAFPLIASLTHPFLSSVRSLLSMAQAARHVGWQLCNDVYVEQLQAVFNIVPVDCMW